MDFNFSYNELSPGFNGDNIEEEVSEALCGLIEKGMVNIVGVNDDGELLYSLSDEARQLFESGPN